MSGTQLRAFRERLGLTQQRAARHWGLSQPYLCLLERGQRRVPVRLAQLLARDEPRMATGLPLVVPTVPSVDLPRLLGSLGYPGFAYLAHPDAVANPAVVLLACLRQEHASTRVTEALPWLLVTFADGLDWEWLIDQAKLVNVQNRLGYLVALALELARKEGNSALVTRLLEAERKLEEARLAKEDALRALTEAERRFLRDDRPKAAAHWNLLTRLRPEDLRYAL